MRETIKIVISAVLILIWLATVAVSVIIAHYGLQRPPMEVLAITAVVGGILGVVLLSFFETISEWLREPAPPPPPQRVIRPAPQPAPAQPQRQLPLMLTNLQLIAIDRSQRGHATRFIQPTQTVAVRPLAIIQLNDQKFAGRQLPIEFNLVDPDNNLHYACEMAPVLKMGVNRVTTSSEFVVNRNTPLGKWHIRLWVGEREWGEQSASFSNLAPIDFDQYIGADMEVSEAADRYAGELAAAFSIDDLLESQRQAQYVPRRRK